METGRPVQTLSQRPTEAVAGGGPGSTSPERPGRTTPSRRGGRPEAAALQPHEEVGMKTLRVRRSIWQAVKAQRDIAVNHRRLIGYQRTCQTCWYCRRGGAAATLRPRSVFAFTAEEADIEPTMFQKEGRWTLPKLKHPFCIVSELTSGSSPAKERHRPSSRARNACAVRAYVHAAVMVLDEMSPPALEARRDELMRERQRSRADRVANLSARG
jgi:hypothetical protein